MRHETVSSLASCAPRLHYLSLPARRRQIIFPAKARWQECRALRIPGVT